MHVYHKIEEDGYGNHGFATDSKIIEELRDHPLYELMLSFLKSIDLDGISYIQIEHILHQAYFDLYLPEE